MPVTIGVNMSWYIKSSTSTENLDSTKFQPYSTGFCKFTEKKHINEPKDTLFKFSFGTTSDDQVIVLMNFNERWVKVKLNMQVNHDYDKTQKVLRIIKDYRYLA